MRLRESRFEVTKVESIKFSDTLNFAAFFRLTMSPMTVTNSNLLEIFSRKLIYKNKV